MWRVYLSFLAVILIIVGVWPTDTPAQAARANNPVDVFIKPDRENEQLTIYFTSAISGLSTVVNLNYFPNHLHIMEEFTLTTNGVIFRDPTDGIPRLITINGNIFDIAFIPQRQENLLRVDWVISPEGRTIAWAEIYFEQRWRADLYVAQLDGANLRALPPLPETDAIYRVAMLAVSDDGSRVFFDLEHPTEARRPDDLFLDYQHVMAYIAPNDVYLSLPEEPACLCSAMITNDGQVFIRMKPETTGYRIQVWNLVNNFERQGVPPIDEIFVQAGDMILSQGGTRVLYTVGGIEGVPIEESVSYALILADLTTGEQDFVSEISEQRLRAIAFIDQNTGAIVVDTDSGQTYKLNFENQTLTPVADGIWLGTLQG